MNAVKNLLYLILIPVALVMAFIDPMKSGAITAIAFLLGLTNFNSK